MNTNLTPPKVSIVVCTYNRAHLLSKAFDQVMNQTYKDWEFVIIDNGSTDDTAKVLEKYSHDERVRVIRVEDNLGCAGGYNFGLDQMKGEWFCTIGDDDVLMEDALEKMMHIPEQVDPEVNAVTANCLRSSNGQFSGEGLHKDQYLNLETIVTKCSGEFWGLTKTELLGDLRFNEDMPGNEDTVWFQIDAVAKRFYIHEPVIIFKDEGDTVTNANKKLDIKRKETIYKALLKEPFYWETLKKYQTSKYRKKCFKAWLFLFINGNKKEARQYARMLVESQPSFKLRMTQQVLSLFGSKGLKLVFQTLSILPMSGLKNYLNN